MAKKTLMFFQIMFTFIFIFTIVIEGFPSKIVFFSFKFFLYVLFPIINIRFFLFDITEFNSDQKCYGDKDCPKFLCMPPSVPKCLRNHCRCVDN
ncbi:unnamed protein product [Trifolium pratense]|uniref:Uncharacterized protein n=1 Tax=Trifolium pratense TaxID=57577 RepID=A0ACB0IE68_TRIPR|nr:unnamed protein product [Trifolium pratense]